MSVAIGIKDLTKRYSNGRGVEGVNLEVNSGEIFGFLGPNGAGKTTTIRCIMDFIRPQTGSIRVFGKDAQQDSVTVKRLVGYLPAENQLYPNWTGQEHIDFYIKTRGISENSNIAKRLGLDTSVLSHQLSTGNKQKLALTLALLGTPKLIVMDEPTKGLDPLLQQEIYDILREYRKQGGSVFVSSHNLPEVEKICDRVGVIKNGSIVANESMQNIRSMSIHVVSFTSGKAINSAEFAGKNVEILHHSGKHILMKVRGDLNTTMQRITAYPLKDLEVNHANLEDIFMEYYR